MSHMNDTLTYHACGGTVLDGGSDDQVHRYCDRCGAFRYYNGASTVALPSGVDADANRAAYDRGDDESPEADA